MQFYLGPDLPLYQSPKNLFSLRFDFHYGGFDRAQFVTVPKWGKLVVHFLGKSSEFANGYHNVIFDHNSNLSHHALYARFAWAVFRRVAEAKLNPKAFKFPNTQNLAPVTSNKEGGGMHKRKREDKDRDEAEDKDKDEADPSGTYQPSRRLLCREQLDALSQGPNAWLSDVLFKMAPDNSRSSLEDDAHEIEEDLKIASRHYPFLGMCELDSPGIVLTTLNLVNSEIEPTASDYENILWYPGIEVVQRRKQAYLDSHPNITAHRGIHEGKDRHGEQRKLKTNLNSNLPVQELVCTNNQRR